MVHGGGGAAMHRLIERVFTPALDNEFLRQQHDAAVFERNGTRFAFTTDSFVVQPLVFPGGDIGSLAVYGTVNDLAMAGARPLYLSAGFIIEAGFPIQTLKEIAASMKRAADAAGVQIVTGDTKVVERGHGDGLFINTSGVGVIEHGETIGPASIGPGDAIIVSGDLGRHGIAIMAVREGLQFETELQSDCAPLANAVLDLLNERIAVHCLRDLTRGGLTSAVNEIATASGRAIHLKETSIPVREDVRGACELLGLDPLSVANEGRFLAIVDGADADRALTVLRRHAPDSAPALIGGVLDAGPARVTIESRIGIARILDMPSGEQLPRIC
jgi:hydrogenase expression/formation protein HypE